MVERGDALDHQPEPAILLVDEAGYIAASALERLQRRDRPFALAALPGFAERLQPTGGAFVQVVLEPLGPEDVARYVAATLAAAGQPVALLEPEAILALTQYSQGLLRVVNSLAGFAMFLAQMEGAARVGQRHVDEANALVHGMAEEDAFAAEIPDRTEGPEEPAAAPAPPDAPSYSDGQPVVGMAEPPSSASEMPEVRSGTYPGEEPSGPAEVPDVSEIEARPPQLLKAALRPPTPRADADVRAAPSFWRMTAERPAARRAKYLGVVAAGLALVLLLGLSLVDVSPSAPSDPDGATPARPAAIPLAPAAGVPAQSPPSEESSPERGETAPAAPAGIAPSGSEARPPRRDRPADERAAPADLPGPPPPAPSAPPPQASVGRVAAFRGTVFNETLRRGGRLTLVVRGGDQPGPVSIRFDASNGLIGSGELRGNLTSDGRITASGTLMMGRNPHECELTGRISGDSLTGSAIFSRSTPGTATQSTFRLTRSSSPERRRAAPAEWR
ncbi:hypothetical protein J8J14_19465 [Roseomonas sp. SSH11]|uniref:Uncharacterized protein n=1 Tax=Pararoseomonas baculiformis TaxID=2820812 RepID=A0ABS4AJC9_9PROT|nr:hypothetical protein [Pararoseomonas baculiformis]MBP0446959.1 hypothetical protein [Pararoseomonas baculiformis]